MWNYRHTAPTYLKCSKCIKHTAKVKDAVNEYIPSCGDENCEKTLGALMGLLREVKEVWEKETLFRDRGRQAINCIAAQRVLENERSDQSASLTRIYKKLDKNTKAMDTILMGDQQIK